MVDQKSTTDDRPPEPGQSEKFNEFKIEEIPFRYEGESDYPIRKALVTDVKGLLHLINGFAASNLMLPRGPQYVYENLRDFVVITDGLSPEGASQKTGPSIQKIIACGSLHLLWEDMAEIRAMAIDPDYQHKGLGRKLVDFMKEEARALGIRRIYTFTLAEDFFQMIGFIPQSREELPAKIWGECSRCPKYFNCDEVGMILSI